jgi:hypothetical protein
VEEVRTKQMAIDSLKAVYITDEISNLTWAGSEQANYTLYYGKSLDELTVEEGILESGYRLTGLDA